MTGSKLFKWSGWKKGTVNKPVLKWFSDRIGYGRFSAIALYACRQFTAGPPYTWHQDVCIYQWAYPIRKNDPFRVFLSAAGSNHWVHGCLPVHRQYVHCIYLCTAVNPWEYGSGNAGYCCSWYRQCAHSGRVNIPFHADNSRYGRIWGDIGTYVHLLWDHCPRNTFHARPCTGDVLPY